MFSFFWELFDTSDFPARWHCGNWSEGLGWLHILSDCAIFGAYFAIPVVLGFFVMRRRDVPFTGIFWLFAAFILSCGIGHAVEASLFWHPWYRFSGLVKLATALVSWATVIALIPMLPKALALPGLAKVNEQLAHEIAERKRSEEERRVLEAQFQHSQKLESLGVMAGGIAHDFNNMLASILGYADLARRDLPAGSPCGHHLAEVIHGTRRAAELTNQMLAFSGKGRFVVEPMNLAALVADMSRLLQVSISKNSTLQISSAADLPAVDADAPQLRQIIMNLIINASEAIGEKNGVIRVRTDARHCDLAFLRQTFLGEQLPEGRYVFLEVADTGCGMSEETRARIFDPFFSTKFTGRGLGLAAVLGIVRGHRGAIEVLSAPGKGTTFRVLFPASRLPVKSGEPPKADDEGWTTNGTVLVVDDEETVRKMAARMMKTMGFTVLTAADGREGVEVFSREADRINLVLLDMTMPQMNGEEALREMRRLRSDMKAILSSGYDEETATASMADRGVAAFIQKPYSYDALESLTRKVLQG